MDIVDIKKKCNFSNFLAGVMMCGVGFLAAVGYCILDTIGCRKMDKNHVFNVKSPPLVSNTSKRAPSSFIYVDM